ncbi:hypothetical protein ACFLSJ_04565 [Verrucomicrobiota bacterium]
MSSTRSPSAPGRFRPALPSRRVCMGGMIERYSMAIKHTIRSSAGGTEAVRLTARSAIRAFCRECVGWNRDEVRQCTAPLCPLWPFRTSDTPKDTV